MTSRRSGFEEADLPRSDSESRAVNRLGPLSLLVVSAWCGLVAGLFETAIIVVRKRYVDLNHFYGMSRDFVWLVPLIDLLLFVVLGFVLSLLVRCGSRGQEIAPRVLGTLALLPLFWSAFPRIYGGAGLLLAMGAAAWLVPALERRSAGFARMVRLTFPIALCVLVILGATCWASDRQKEWHEASRPLPPPNSPNVLLVVLDTVAAGHLSLLGYNRPTSPTIDELASRGICFKRARATASWTLPSHSSMFTGRWPHELSAGWFTPLDAAAPTVAEYLGERGYVTAGFAANVAYCASDSGLARGFTTYHDFIFPRLTSLHLTAIVGRVVDGIQGAESLCAYALGVPFLRPAADLVWQLVGNGRKEAAVVNREFLGWLSARQRQDRPFFAFLNYYDAHYPYELPATGIHRFGAVPRNEREKAVLRDWNEIQKGDPSKGQIAFARDCYDDCLAHLDEELGILIDELERRSILERTWVIITADHGESFGEHPRVFVHGTTLYLTESHVPLVVIPPGGIASPIVVSEPISLRDLAATIVGVSGLKADSHIPGDSLTRFWQPSSDATAADGTGPSSAFSELSPENPLYANIDRQGTDIRIWPVASLIEGDWSYTRREGDQLELLFNLREDPGELRNLANDPSLRPTLARLRTNLGRLTNGPLTPDRFNP
jgi:arylsulfatase A-like enzyme